MNELAIAASVLTAATFLIYFISLIRDWGNHHEVKKNLLALKKPDEQTPLTPDDISRLEAIVKQVLNLKSLGIPKGSVRSLLAFLIVGGYLAVIMFGKDALTTTIDATVVGDVAIPASTDTTLYTNVVSGLTGLVGAVVGFYFGGKTGSENPGEPSG